MKDKTRTYHANLLKKFIEREEEEPNFVASFIDYEGKQEDPSHEEIIDELEISPNQEKTAYDINEKLNGEKREELQQVIKKHDNIFSDKPGSAKIESHIIPLTPNVPIVLEMYRMPKFRDPRMRMHMRISLHEDPRKRMHMQISKDGDPRMRMQMRISVQEDPRMRMRMRIFVI